VVATQKPMVAVVVVVGPSHGVFTMLTTFPPHLPSRLVVRRLGALLALLVQQETVLTLPGQVLSSLLMVAALELLVALE